MELLLLVFIMALMVCLGVMIVLIQREFNLHRELLKIFDEHLSDELKQQEEAIKELNEILNFKR